MDHRPDIARHHWRGRAQRVLAAACATLVAAAVMAVPSPASADVVITKTGTGTYNGYFYEFWCDQPGQASMTLSTAGNYSMSWGGNVGDVIAGIGWRVGGRRTVSYTSTLQTSGNAFVSLYGMTKNPKAEYYVVENWGSYRPTATLLGTVTSDGAVYDIYRQQHYLEFDSFATYWSVRKTKRTSGTITFGNHLDAWAKAGMKVGSFDYQIMATEGYQSAGSSRVNVLTPPTDRPPSSTPPATTPAPSAA